MAYYMNENEKVDLKAYCLSERKAAFVARDAFNAKN